MKPMLAKAARQPSQLTANNSPEDLSLKTHCHMPVDLSSKPCSSEKVQPVFAEPSSSCVSATCTSVSVCTAGSSTSPATPSVPVATSRSNSTHRSDEAPCVPSTVANLQSPVSSENVQIMTEAVNKRIENISILTSPSSVSPSPYMSSLQPLASPSGTASSVMTTSADGAFSCQKRALDHHVGQPVSDGVLPATSRYCRNFVASC